MNQLSRRISPATLFVLSLNAIIGSGWLFAPLYAAKIAGPAAVISWVIGGLAAILIAFTFAEISTMLPVAGGTAHIPQLSHGTLVSFILGWIAWISSLIMTPVEVQAVLQYASLYFPSLMEPINHTPTLTWWGLVWAGLLMFSLCIINVVSYKGLMRFNFIVFLFKFLVILLTILAIFHAQFIPANFATLSDSIHSASGWKAIFSAVATGGIVLAFNGFKSGVELAGEAKRLSLSIPLSTAGAVSACLLLYLILQICFIGAVAPSSLNHGWQQLTFNGDLGPFVGLATALGIFWLIKFLYINSVVSPLGAGLIYVTSTARILYALGKMGFVPRFLTHLNKQRLPMWAILVNFVVGLLAFFPLPGWQSMVNFLVSAMVITYAMGPVALLCLRSSLPHQKRPFKIPLAHLVCLLAFYCCNLFSYWTGWETVSKLTLTLLTGALIFGFAYWRGKVTLNKNELKSALWIIPYLCGLVFISYLGSFGGIGVLSFGWDFLVIALFSIFILCLAVYSRADIKNVEEILFSEAQLQSA